MKDTVICIGGTLIVIGIATSTVAKLRKVSHENVEITVTVGVAVACVGLLSWGYGLFMKRTSQNQPNGNS
jgi:hypothetical protein